MPDEQFITTQQDGLRTLRQFVGTVGGALAGYENATAWTDGRAYSLPGQYQVIGRNGVYVEGTPYGLPIQATPGGGVYISPMVVLIGIGAAVAFFWKR